VALTVVGALMNNQWSVAGWGSGQVNQMLIQPFVNYNLPDHWYLVSAPILTANWAAAKAGDVWTAPLGGGGKLFRLGQILPLEGHEIAKLPINTQLQAFGNVAKPQFGSDWQLRFQVQLLFSEVGEGRGRSVEGRVKENSNQIYRCQVSVFRFQPGLQS
jgi:hypothetical protein